MKVSDETPGKMSLTKAKAKVDHALAFYDELMSADIPESIILIGDVSEPLVEKFVPPLDKEELQIWHRRAIPIEAVNRILRTFEVEVIQSLTVSSTSLILREVHKVLKRYEFFIGHIGELTLIITGALAFAEGYFEDDLKRGSANAWRAIMSLDAKALKAAIIERAKLLQEIAGYILESAILGIVTSIVEASLVAFTAEKWAEHVGPMIEVRKRAIQSLKDAAFPQGKGRVRRIKRSMKN